MNPVINDNGNVYLGGDKIGRVFQSGRSKRWYYVHGKRPASKSFTHAELAAEALVVAVTG